MLVLQGIFGARLVLAAAVGALLLVERELVEVDLDETARLRQISEIERELAARGAGCVAVDLLERRIHQELHGARRRFDAHADGAGRRRLRRLERCARYRREASGRLLLAASSRKAEHEEREHGDL